MIYLISISYFILLVLNERRHVYPDSERYISSERLMIPFSLRWLIRAICGKNEILWNVFSYVPVIAIPIVSYYYFLALGFSDNQSLIGGALVCGLSGVTLVNYAVKYLSDGFGMLCMVTSLLMFQTGLMLWGIIFSLIGSMANEKTFVYVSLMSLNPYALIGGIAVLVRYLTYKHAKEDFLGGTDILNKPFGTGFGTHKGFWFDIKRSVLIWGVASIAIMNIDLHLGIVLLVAYGSVLMATDSTRLIQWVFPAVVAGALSVFPEAWAVPLIALHWLNPYRVNCI